jgi:hypothetical protein
MSEAVRRKLSVSSPPPVPGTDFLRRFDDAP